MSSLRNITMGSIQLGPTLTSWTRTVSSATSFALLRCSTRIIQGSSPAKEVASVANESAWVFPLLEMCDKLNRSKPDRRRLTWLRYSCILASLASNFPSPGLLPVSNPKTSLIFFLPSSAPWSSLTTRLRTRLHYSWPRTPVLGISL